MDLKKIALDINKAASRLDQIDKELSEIIKLKEDTERKQVAVQEAKTFINGIAQKTQENFSACISNLVSSALAAVLPNPYQFELRYVQRRGATECDLVLIDADKNELSLEDSVGGGVLDIVSLGLRLAVWRLSQVAPLIILDEPFRNLQPVSLHSPASAFIKELSHQLGIQFIIVSSCKTNLIDSADRVFLVENGNVTILN